MKNLQTNFTLKIIGSDCLQCMLMRTGRIGRTPILYQSLKNSWNHEELETKKKRFSKSSSAL